MYLREITSIENGLPCISFNPFVVNTKTNNENFPIFSGIHVPFTHKSIDLINIFQLLILFMLNCHLFHQELTLKLFFPLFLDLLGWLQTFSIFFN